MLKNVPISKKVIWYVMQMTVCHESNQSVREHTRKLCCTKDESRPLAIAIQVEIANLLKVL